MILAVSDVHLGYDGCNKEAFSKFLDKCESIEIEHLVLLGDFFDFWRRNNAKIITENEDILEKLNNLNAKNIHYIVGNHDYYMFNLSERYEDNFPFKISKNLRLEDGGNRFYFIHGYEFEVLSLEPMTLEMYEEFSEKMCFSEDIIGGIAGHLWDFIQGSGFKEKFEKNPRERLESLKETNKIYEFATSKGKSFLLGMKTDERLVFGHTHGPFINNEKTVANTGSWVNELPNKEYHNSYVEISGGTMELKFFKL
jgi:UDP-2,3-diacylglucosamine pyrophosphatase LpxH